jgi:cytochrome c
MDASRVFVAASLIGGAGRPVTAGIVGPRNHRPAAPFRTRTGAKHRLARLDVLVALLRNGRNSPMAGNPGGGNMISRYLGVGVLVGALSLGSSVALAQGDADAGEKVFNKCKACHVADEAQNRVGPHLVGIFGRQAGSVDGFKYSDAMKESGVTWNEETIAEYIADPRGYIKGNRMAFVGLKDEEEIADLIAYLKEATAS